MQSEQTEARANSKSNKLMTLTEIVKNFKLSCLSFKDSFIETVFWIQLSFFGQIHLFS